MKHSLCIHECLGLKFLFSYLLASTAAPNPTRPATGSATKVSGPTAAKASPITQKRSTSATIPDKKATPTTATLSARTTMKPVGKRNIIYEALRSCGLKIRS